MNEHNPITIRLDEMVNVWKKNVRPQHSLIRWMLKPDEHRMYEGFCRLEASPYGKLDNLFVFFYTPFNSMQTYSHAIMQNWLHKYNDPQQRQALEQAGVQGEWNVQTFQQAVTDNDYATCDRLLPVMIQSYRTWLKLSQAPLVLSLLPREMQSPGQFAQWLQQWMQQSKPVALQLLVFDHTSGNYWGNVFEEYGDKAVSLQHDLRMQEAVKQIATAGAATDPYAFFRKCMFEMGEAANRKDKLLLGEWGEKAIECAKKAGDKNLLATAYITFAGMLFNFKDHEHINRLLDTGMRLCQREVTAGNNDMKPLLLQYYTYKGADCQIRKERKEALQWFMKTGDEADTFGMAQQALSAYYKAWIFADYKNWQKEKDQAAIKALRLTNRLSDEEVQASEYPYLAYEYLKQPREHDELAVIVEQKMLAAYGTGWQKTVEELKQNYTKKKIREADKEMV